MKTIALILALTSVSSYAAITITVPSKNILTAARTLVVQTGSVYAVNGNITCTAINTGTGPATSNCEISINANTAVVENADEIISAVMKYKTPTGPYYTFTGRFLATSLSTATPPYRTTTSAKIIVN